MTHRHGYLIFCLVFSFLKKKDFLKPKNQDKWKEHQNSKAEYPFGCSMARTVQGWVWVEGADLERIKKKINSIGF